MFPAALKDHYLDLSSFLWDINSCNFFGKLQIEKFVQDTLFFFFFMKANMQIYPGFELPLQDRLIGSLGGV